MKESMEIAQYALEVIHTLEGAGYEAYVVGGCVRDMLLERPAQDWDITTSASPEQIKRVFPRTIDTGIAHGTVTVMMGKVGCEVTTYRVDGAYRDGRHPESVEFTKSLEEDLKRRDFTINAMAYNPRTGIIDLFDGKGDLDRRLIRCVGDARERFTEDALRMMRAVRFSAQLGFSIEEKTAEAAGKLSGRLAMVSRERVQAELVKLLVSDNPDRLLFAAKLGLADDFLRCFSDEESGEQERRVRAAAMLPPVKSLRLAAVLCPKKTTSSGEKESLSAQAQVLPVPDADLGKLALEVMHSLKFDNDTAYRVKNLCAWSTVPPCIAGLDEKSAKSRVRRCMSALGRELFFDLLKLRGAIYPENAANERRALQLAEQICTDKDALSLKELAVSGKDLIAEGAEPGRQLGAILESMLEQVLDDPKKNDREYLLSLIRERKY